MPGRNSCQYRKEYTEVGTKEPFGYECSRTALPDDENCELHSEELWRTDPDRVVAALKEELERSPNKEGHRCFVGFNLPNVDLSGMRFDGQVYFQHTVFHGRADFKKSTFEKEASFRECMFEEHAFFKQARFGEEADFFGMVSAKYVSFYKAEFSALMLLSACIIKNADFQDAKFSKVLIRRSVFEDADFDQAEFGGHCDLLKSSFGNVSFRDARIKSASISGVKFHKKVDFGLAIFESPKDVRFNSDLTHVSFLEADLSRVRFGSATVWNSGSDPVPYDVREFKEEPKGKYLADALSVMRDLRDNYEYRLEYEGAGKLFVQEMEMKRQYEDADDGARLRPWYWRWFSLTRVYGLSCRYGESLRRPSALALSVFFGSVLFFWLDETHAYAGTCPLADSDKWSYALTRTLAGVLHWGCQELPDYVLRALSIPILGTMFVVLRRRFERRFRH